MLDLFECVEPISGTVYYYDEISEKIVLVIENHSSGGHSIISNPELIIKHCGNNILEQLREYSDKCYRISSTLVYAVFT